MISRTGAIFISISVVFSFLFGGALHAFIPHNHDGGDAITEVMHAALRHEKASFSVAIASLLVLPLVVAISTRPTYALVPRGRRNRLLENGVEQYRRFG